MTARIVHLASAERDRILVLVPPDPVVEHPTGERLLRPALTATAGHPAAIFASRIGRKGKRHLRNTAAIVRLVEIPDLDTVVGVDARAPGVAQGIGAIAVVVKDQRQPLFGTVQNLSSQAAVAIEFSVRLPSVDDPWFDLQLIRGEPLNPQAVEEPWRVRRHERRLISPVIVVVVTEQADVRHEDSSVDIEAVIHVEVVPAPRLRYGAIGVTEVPLAPSRAGIVPRRRGGKHPKHGQDSAANVLPVEVAAHADLFQLEITGPK